MKYVSIDNRKGMRKRMIELEENSKQLLNMKQKIESLGESL